VVNSNIHRRYDMKKKKVFVDMMYCPSCKEVLIEFDSWEKEYYTAFYRATTNGVEFVDRSDSESDYHTDYHCPLCELSIQFCTVEVGVAKVLCDYAKTKAATHFPFEHPEGLGIDEITETEAKKIILQKELEVIK
jgi:hypothetical protein